MDNSTPPSPPPGKNRHKRLLAAIVVILAAAGLFFLGRLTIGSAKTPASARAVPVAIAITKKGDMPITLNALGTVTPPSTVTIKTQVNGRLMSVNYAEGQKVKEGDVLAQIDPRPFQAMLLEAQGQYARDKALLEGANVDLKRYQDAYAKNAIPKQQLDDQVALVHQYEGTVKLDLGTYYNAKVQLGYCRITSPVTGRVGLRLVDPGNYVQTSDTTGLLVITQTQPITVIFSVAEDFLPEIEEQLSAGNKLSVDIYDREQTKKLAAGSLLAIDNEIDPTTGTVKLRAQFDNEDDALFPNQFVNATLLVKTLHDVVLVPTQAIQRNGQEAFVYVVYPDQTAKMQKVTTGTTDGKVIVVEGIDAGAAVVTDGFDKLQDGMKVSNTQNNSTKDNSTKETSLGDTKTNKKAKTKG
jgi:multidrug efflux system membrane fusion protein